MRSRPSRVRRSRPRSSSRRFSPRARGIVTHLEAQGASFFAGFHEAAGAGFPGETVDALWDLVWKGLVTNDTFHALRAFTRPPERRRRRGASPAARNFRN